MAKLIRKYLIGGIGWGSFFFIVNLIIADLRGLPFTEFVFADFTIYALGYILLGIALYGTSIVYEIERLRFAFKLVIHLLVGIGALLFAMYIFPLVYFNNFVSVILSILPTVFILLGIWIYEYFKVKREVEKVNAKLKEQDLARSKDTE